MKNENDHEYNESNYTKRDCNAQNANNQLEVSRDGRPAPAIVRGAFSHRWPVSFHHNDNKLRETFV